MSLGIIVVAGISYMSGYAAARMEQEALLETYMAALGMIAAPPEY